MLKRNWCSLNSHHNSAECLKGLLILGLPCLWGGHPCHSISQMQKLMQKRLKGLPKKRSQSLKMTNLGYETGPHFSYSHLGTKKTLYKRSLRLLLHEWVNEFMFVFFLFNQFSVPRVSQSLEEARMLQFSLPTASLSSLTSG